MRRVEKTAWDGWADWDGAGIRLLMVQRPSELKLVSFLVDTEGERGVSSMTITSSVQAQPVASVTSSQSSPSKAPSDTSTQKDSVQISSSAKAALQEATEAPDQTAKEARGGDHQAQRLLAKEAAEEKASEG